MTILKNVLLLVTFISIFGIAKAQNSNNDKTKFIEVTGSAELEIDPDEFSFLIGIQEYWKEEFDKNTDYKDYKTKIPIDQIESKLLADLGKLGIKKENITLHEVGNYWRASGKEFLIGKQLELHLFDLRKIDEIIGTINIRGVDYMQIGELKNKGITDFRKQVKIEALKAAKNKAEYLLASIDKKVGDIISIVEVDNQIDFWTRRDPSSNTLMASPGNPGSDNLRKIKLRYEIKAAFEIK